MKNPKILIKALSLIARTDGGKTELNARACYWLAKNALEEYAQQSEQADGFICTVCKTTYTYPWLTCPSCDKAQVIRREVIKKINVYLQESATEEQIEELIYWLEKSSVTGAVFVTVEAAQQSEQAAFFDALAMVADHKLSDQMENVASFTDGLTQKALDAMIAIGHAAELRNR